ncbi:pilus assembly protein [Herbaspirillum sp. HC18]|nr:pilus assembly protein [Herbaspirillum sp. HC18]
MKVTRAKQHVAAKGFFRQRGASLLEGLAYLGIAATVIMGAVSLLSSAFGNAQANQVVEETVALRTAVRKLYAGQTYPTAILPTLISVNGFPGTLAVNRTSNTLKNAWGGAVDIAGVTGGGTFTISYSSVPQGVCISMISGANGWTQIAGSGSTAVTTFPATAAAASGACAAGDNTVVLTAS